ncbi:MAG TPA: hypothetical protein VH914_02600 [Acidimicrobiia bacterium]|jgi:hypothetical protein|nr:hypothetical protein [Acidimicrobiia bacterium]
MRRARWLVVVAFSLAIVSAPAAAGARIGNAPVRADAGHGGGDFGGTPPVLGVGLLVATPGAHGGLGATYRADDPGAPRPMYTRAIPATSEHPDLSNLCFTPAGPTGPEYGLGNGWLFDIHLFSTADGRDLGTIGSICQPLTAPAVDGPPAPPDVPQPPTIGAVWRAIGLGAPPLGTSPAARGVTGLPTWIWTGAAAPAGVAVGLDGYRVAGTARVAGYAVYTGEGRWARVASAGTPDAPALTHTYEHRGTYRLGVATIWTASATMTGPGLGAPITIDLGAALVTNARDYPVVSIRSVLLP